MTRTIKRIYDTFTEARAAILAVKLNGIDHDDINVATNQDHPVAREHLGEPLCSEATETGTGVGSVVGGAAGLLAGLGLIAIPGFGPIVTAG